MLGGVQEGCCCRVRDLGGCCRVGVQTRTHQHRLLSRAGLCGMLKVTLPLPRMLTILGAGPPPSSDGSPPLSGSAKQRGGSLIFPGDPADAGAVGTHVWGVSVASLLWGWVHSLPCALGQSWLGQGGWFAAILGAFGSGGNGAGDTGHGGKASSWFNPRDGVFSVRSALPA